MSRSSNEPIYLGCHVVLDRGSWWVELEFLFEDGIRRKRVNSFRSEGRARVAARWIGWAAQRDIDPPMGM